MHIYVFALQVVDDDDDVPEAPLAYPMSLNDHAAWGRVTVREDGGEHLSLHQEDKVREMTNSRWGDLALYGYENRSHIRTLSAIVAKLVRESGAPSTQIGKDPPWVSGLSEELRNYNPSKKPAPLARHVREETAQQKAVRKQRNQVFEEVF